MRVGTPIDLRGFVDQSRASGRERVREAGAPLAPDLPAPRREAGGRRGAADLRARAGDRARRRRSAARGRRGRAREAPLARPASRRAPRRSSREIAAPARTPPCWRCWRCWSTSIFKRIFARVELQRPRDRSIECARSSTRWCWCRATARYFDFLILSWLFYAQPPGAAARRRAREHGVLAARLDLPPRRRLLPAPQLRRTRSTSAVFRSYVAHLIKEGFTQEFFIEGSALAHGQDAARRGSACCAWCSRRYARGARRDLYLRAGRLHLRAPGRGGLDGRRSARARRSSARACSNLFRAARRAALPLRQRVRELRRADLAGQAARGPTFPRRVGPGPMPDLRADDRRSSAWSCAGASTT